MNKCYLKKERKEEERKEKTKRIRFNLKNIQ